MGEKVTLVGGGLAGSLLSIYLAKRGYDVHLFERRGDMRNANYEGGRSINLAMSNRGLRALEEIGLDRDILEMAIPMNGRMMHDKVGQLAYQPYGKEGQAIHSVSRGGLNIKLLQLADAYPNISMYFNHTCVQADLESGITRYRGADGKEVEDRAEFVIATDGAYSAVREAFQHSGRFDYSQKYEAHGYKELEIPAGEGGAFQLNKNCLHIWPRKSFMMIALPNPDGSFTCTLFQPFEGDPGFDDLLHGAAVEKFFSEEFPDALAIMPTLVEDFMKNPVGSLVTVKCYPWVKERFALLGDSAHAIVPFYGQGMNCAFEDCMVLNQCLETHNNDWKKAFATYQELRKMNADAISDLAVQNFTEMRDLVGDPEFLHRKHLEHELMELYPDLFHSQYELVTFSKESYDYARRQGQNNSRLLDRIIAEKLESRISERDMMEKMIRESLVKK